MRTVVDGVTCNAFVPGRSAPRDRNTPDGPWVSSTLPWRRKPIPEPDTADLFFVSERVLCEFGLCGDAIGFRYMLAPEVVGEAPKNVAGVPPVLAAPEVAETGLDGGLECVVPGGRTRYAKRPCCRGGRPDTEIHVCLLD